MKAVKQAGSIRKEKEDNKALQGGGSPRCRSPTDPPPCVQGSRKIQLPYHNNFKTIWEYKKSFLAGEIDFATVIGPTCPLCAEPGCYRQITAYWRYATELFAEFEKRRIPIARFLCRRRKKTFSLLPIQLIPYYQYTASAVLGVILLALGCRQKGQRGFFGACSRVHPDCLITPWLVACWSAMILGGFRRAHGLLSRVYDLSRVSYSKFFSADELYNYLLAFDIRPNMIYQPKLLALLDRYSYASQQFLFAIPSQLRTPMRH